MTQEQIWLIVGFIGQTVFASRFLIQWVVSERASKSIIPNIFWWISLAGSMILLSYAIHKVDPVFIVGQSCGFLIYSRNIYLIKKEGKNKKNAKNLENVRKQSSPFFCGHESALTGYAQTLIRLN